MTEQYISITRFGMPRKNEVTDVAALNAVFGHLDVTYRKSVSQDMVWTNKDTTIKIEVTSSSVVAHIIFYHAQNGWKHLKTITFQDYYNDVIAGVADPTPPAHIVLTSAQRNALIKDSIRNIDDVRYSSTLSSIEKDNILKHVTEVLNVIYED